jgi:hypothetical protein
MDDEIRFKLNFTLLNQVGGAMTLKGFHNE